MKTYKVTLRDSAYLEKEIIVKASSKEEAAILANELNVNPDEENKRAEWHYITCLSLKPKVRIAK